MSVAATILYWILMIFLQYSDFSQIQSGDSFFYYSTDYPGAKSLNIQVDCVGDPSLQGQYYWKMIFTATQPDSGEQMAEYTAFVYRDAGAYKLKLLRDGNHASVYPRNDKQPPLFLSFGNMVPKKNIMINADEHYLLPVTALELENSIQTLDYSLDGMNVSISRNNGKYSLITGVTISLKEYLFSFQSP